MNVARRKDMERLAFAGALAMAFHISLFLILHFGGFLLDTEVEGYLGPIIIELEGPRSLPDKTVGVTEEAPPRDVPASEEPSKENTETTPVDRPVADPDNLAGDQGNSDVLSTETEDAADSGITDSTPTEPLYEAPQAAPPREENIFSDTDEAGNELAIEMGAKTDKAKPAIRLPIKLPGWVKQEGRRMEIVFSFIAGPDGRITYLNVDKSSGFEDVDRAVILSFRDWQFSNPMRNERILGTFTYRIGY